MDTWILNVYIYSVNFTLWLGKLLEHFWIVVNCLVWASVFYILEWIKYKTELEITKGLSDIVHAGFLEQCAGLRGYRWQGGVPKARATPISYSLEIMPKCLANTTHLVLRPWVLFPRIPSTLIAPHWARQLKSQLRCIDVNDGDKCTPLPHPHPHCAAVRGGNRSSGDGRRRSYWPEIGGTTWAKLTDSSQRARI